MAKIVKKKKVIIVPIDANEQSEVALSQSYNLANLTNASLLLLGVDDGHNPNIKQRLEKLLAEAKDHTQQPVEIQVKSGKDVFKVITEVADKIKPISIILGITQMPGGKMRGNNALQMIRKSKHPIISIGGKTHRDGCKKIVMPLDLGLLSREKVKRVVSMATRFNATVKIVSTLTNESKEEEAKLHSYAKQCLKYFKKMEVKGVSKFIKAGKRDIVEALLEYSTEVEADLIVIIDDEDRSFKEYFSGTAAQRLINTSKIPVLSLRPIERKETFSYY